ncbi:Acyl-CoA N-acyltransferase [Pleurostoma richardsiae]|uniref:Acyl-CoA N-acyltransferase n=1 Tax=Pleurostoma richardsiae TaxID=41990 RepID=A0AA38RJU5_9PEZI|nr:Acyl-CoA N-acyltransferase [Pleurostoma richardsiae]
MSLFIVTGCTVADAEALARNNMSAFWTDSNWRALWNRGQTLDFIIEQSVKRMPRNLLRDRESLRHLKALDPNTGRLVGYARWILPDDHLNTEPTGEPVWVDGRVPNVSPEERLAFERLAGTANWHHNHAMDHLDVPVTAMKAALISKKQYIVLDYLAVHPENKRKGIATALVEAGIAKARQLGLDILVTAFKQGFYVYRKLGFETLDQIIQDDSMYGGDGEYAVYFMEYAVSKA